MFLLLGRAGISCVGGCWPCERYAVPAGGLSAHILAAPAGHSPPCCAVCRYQWHGTAKLMDTLQELHDEAQREMEEVRAWVASANTGQGP